MNLLREYIRELLLIEADDSRTDERGYIIGADGKKYNPQGRNQWELPYQFKRRGSGPFESGVLGQIRYYPEEDGTWNIKPPGPFPSQFAGVEGYVFHDAHGNTRYGNSVKYGGKVAGVNLAPGQSAEEHFSDDGSIVVAHPELYQRLDDYHWFTTPEWVEYYKKALEKINTLGGDAFPFAKFQGFIAQAQDPNSEWAKKLKDLGVAEGHIESYARAFYDPGDEDWVLQASTARKGAEMQGISFALFKWLGGHLDWMKNYYKKSVNEGALLELLDMYEEYRSAPKPVLEDDAAATEAGKELAFQLAGSMYMPLFAKSFAKVWRKLKISPKEEIKAFSTYARGNSTDGYPKPRQLLKKHDETTYPDGIIYEIPDEAYAALARYYYD